MKYIGLYYNTKFQIILVRILLNFMMIIFVYFFPEFGLKPCKLTLYSTETKKFFKHCPPSKIETYDIKIPWAGEPVPRGKQCFNKTFVFS